MKTSFTLLLSAVAGAILITACASTENNAQKVVRVGMSKATVLELAGNPTRITRHLGQDRWLYGGDPSGSVAESGVGGPIYVYFSEGLVTYVGSAALDSDVGSGKAGSTAPATGFKPIGE